MDNKIFSGLEDLGFDNVEMVDLYKKKEELQKAAPVKKDNPLDLLYDVEVTCPVCGNKFKAKAVKTNAARIMKKDSDFCIHYDKINPYFYDVYLCNVCGYAAMKTDFFKIREREKELIQNGISIKWHGRDYKDVFDVNTAIERYKLCLLNNAIMESKASKKAMNCLKIAWMYRLAKDKNNEQLFLNQALQGFTYAYENEEFPLYNSLDKYTTMYLLGELNRLASKNDEALSWFSKVITSPGVNQKIKEMAIDQKDLMKRESEMQADSNDDEEDDEPKKQGLFSRLFK